VPLSRRLFGASGERPTLSALPLIVAGIGLLALIAPLRAAEQPLGRIGVLLVLVGVLEVLHGVRRTGPAAVRRALTSAVITVLMGLLLINAPLVAGTALVLLLALSFAVDAVGYGATAWRSTERRARRLGALAALGNLTVSVLLLVAHQISVTWLLALVGGLRILGIAWAMATSPVHTIQDASRTAFDVLGVGEHPEAAALQEQVAAEERARAPSDLRWTLAFVVTLFAIHVTRMRPDGSLLGLVAPAVAVLGDMTLAVLVALILIVPPFVSLRMSTRWLERLVWRRHLARAGAEGAWRRRIRLGWLRYRLRMGMRLREAQYSVLTALRRSLALGLPIAAIIAATVPMWGMSWFFDSENWATGIWNSWAESRTDEWREAMVRAVSGDGARLRSTEFMVTPPGGLGGDFAFVVIGDPGEGDASQHVLRDQLLAVAGHADVRFVVVSSDVVYPNGSMIDYEAKFWLPFKGVSKPVYAIPGNHDWYDALEAFQATFLEAGAARTAMHARAQADLRLTSTTRARIDRLIGEAQRLRAEYEVPTGFQRGPFFEVQGDRFALVAIDTGIVQRIDPAQWAWLESALQRARGKLTMAVLGHPFYAGGYDMTRGNEAFGRLKRLLLDHRVTIMMAGDTHDLEYYSDLPRHGAWAAHYFVNGGGGAYLSLGTALAWPRDPPTARWAFYPGAEAVSRKIEAQTPWWKRPAWWWTTRAGGWPLSAEWMSAAFDYNTAPFFQSFIEVRVEVSASRVRLLPYGVHGRLRWRDLTHSSDLRPAGVAAADPVEWIVPMP